MIAANSQQSQLGLQEPAIKSGIVRYEYRAVGELGKFSNYFFNWRCPAQHRV